MTAMRPARYTRSMAAMRPKAASLSLHASQPPPEAVEDGPMNAAHEALP